MDRARTKILLFLSNLCVLGASLSLAIPAAHADALDDAAAQLRPSYVEDIDRALSESKVLGERLAANDIDGARHAWISARVGWERAEVFTAAFVPDLDDKIDAWPDARTGFHAIEARLFGGDPSDLGPEVNTLVFYLNDLDIKVHDTPLVPQHILNGTARLVYEVGEDKADGGESRFSGTSLDDMRNNLIGIKSAYETAFQGALSASNPELAKSIAAQIEQMGTLLQVPDLKSLDQTALRKLSEELVVSLQSAASDIGLRQPTFTDLVQ
jgi:iron uptake system component EfeO